MKIGLLPILIILLAGPAHAQRPIQGITALSGVSPDLPHDELEPLVGPLFKTTSILGIGENIHGSKEILQMEHRLVKYAVEKEKVRHLFLEQGQFVAEKLNEYVQTCEGDVTKLVHAASWYPAEDEINLMQWLCQFNLLHPLDKVQIHGVDIYNFASLDHAWFLEQLHGTELYDSAKSILDHSANRCIGFGKTYEEYKKEFYAYYEKRALIDPINFIECEHNLHNLQNVLTNKPGNQKNISSVKLATLKTYVRNLLAVQNYWLSRTVFNDDFERMYRYRDSAMAENVVDLWRALGQPKSLFIAHTSHAAKYPAPFYKNWKNADISPAGSFIFKMLGDQYKVIGFTGYGTDGAQGDYIPPVSQDSLDKVLHTLHYTYAWLNVTQDKKFNRNWWVQNENGETQTEYSNGVLLNPSTHYDAMIYIDRAQASYMCE